MAAMCAIPLITSLPSYSTNEIFFAAFESEGGYGFDISTFMRQAPRPSDAVGVLNPGCDRDVVATALATESQFLKMPPPTFTEEELFVGSYYIYQGQLINDDVLESAIYFHPVFIQNRMLCLSNASPSDPDLIGIPMTTAPHTIPMGVSRRSYYRIYVDLMASRNFINDQGMMYTLEKRVDNTSFVVSETDRVSAGDVVFVENAAKLITLYIVTEVNTAVVPFNRFDTELVLEERDVRRPGWLVKVKPFYSTENKETMESVEQKRIRIEKEALPISIKSVGWVEHYFSDNDNPYVEGHDKDAVTKLHKRLLQVAKRMADQHDKDTVPEQFYMAGIAAPVQPTQFEGWKSVINATVLINANVMIVVGWDFYDKNEWLPGDAIEIRLGIPRADDNDYVIFSKSYMMIQNGVRLEIDYGKPSDKIPCHWDKCVWKCTIGRFIVEETHGYYKAALIMLKPQTSNAKKDVGHY